MSVPARAAQQDSASVSRSLRVDRVRDGAIELDGRLTESAWLQAEVGGGFTQRVPADGSPATERTEVRVLYSGDALYVGVRAFDSEPHAIRAELARRDSKSQSDEIAVYVDSYHDRRTCFEFAVTPRGSIRDAYYFNDAQWSADASWDPVWEVGTSTDAAGWSAEFRIPFTQLRFDRQSPVWGFQVYRRILRKAEEVYWAPFPQSASGFPSLFGTLTGFTDLPRPLRLEGRPYTVAQTRARPPATGILFAPEQDSRANGGLDIKFGLTTDFTLDLSLNPDFGQVEADPAVVNLSAFETFFPEKRPFFVEGSGLFSASLPLGQLSYSRRIGRRPQGFASPPAGGTVEIPEASTILAAGKVTGKTRSGLGLGLMGAVTAEEEAALRDATGRIVGREAVEPRTYHLVGRVEQDFRRGSHTVGALVTAVERSLPGSLSLLRSSAYAALLDGEHRWRNNAYAVRWNVAASLSQGSRQAITAAQRSSLHYYQRPDAPHLELDTTRTGLSGYFVQLSAGREAGRWQYGASVQQGSPGFDIGEGGFQWGPADVREGRFWVQYLQSRPRWVFRNFRAVATFWRSWTTGGEPTTLVAPFVFVGATFRNNWELLLNPMNLFWSSLCTSCLRGGPALTQNTLRGHFVRITTDRRKPVALGLTAYTGGRFGARTRWLGTGATLFFRPTGALNGSIRPSYDWTREPEQWVARRTALGTTRYLLGEIDQRTLSVTARLNWTLSPKLSIEFYGQPFVSAGSYDTFKEVTAPRARTLESRFRTYGQELVCDGNGACEVDLNGDGSSDLSFQRPDFNFRQLRSTLVLRWEYRPGSVLFIVWQHGRQQFLGSGSFGGFRDLGDLFGADSDNTLLVKASYWLSF